MLDDVLRNRARTVDVVFGTVGTKMGKRSATPDDLALLHQRRMMPLRGIVVGGTLTVN